MKVLVWDSGSESLEEFLNLAQRRVDIDLFEDVDDLIGEVEQGDVVVFDLDVAKRTAEKSVKKIRKSKLEINLVFICNEMSPKELGKHQKSKVGGDIYLRSPMDEKVFDRLMEPLFGPTNALEGSFQQMHETAGTDTKEIDRQSEIIRAHQAVESDDEEAEQINQKLDSAFRELLSEGQEGAKALQAIEEAEKAEIMANAQLVEVAPELGTEMKMDENEKEAEMAADDNDLEMETNNIGLELGEGDDAGLELGDADDAGLELGEGDDTGLELSDADDAGLELGDGDDAGLELGDGDDAGLELGDGDDAGLELGEGDDAGLELGEGDDAGLELGDGDDAGLELGGADDAGLELGEGDDAGLELGEGDDAGLELGEGDDAGLELGDGDDAGLELGEGDDAGLELGEGDDAGLELGGADEAGLELGEGDDAGLELGDGDDAGLELGEGDDAGLELGEGDDAGLELGGADDANLELGAGDEAGSSTLALGKGSSELGNDDLSMELGEDLSADDTSLDSIQDSEADLENFDLDGQELSDNELFGTSEELSAKSLPDSPELPEAAQQASVSTASNTEMSQSALEKLAEIEEIMRRDAAAGLKTAGPDSTGEVDVSGLEPEAASVGIEESLAAQISSEDEEPDYDPTVESEDSTGILNLNEYQEPSFSASEAFESHLEGDAGKTISEQRDVLSRNDAEFMRLAETIKQLRQDREVLLDKIAHLEQKLDADKKDFTSLEAELEEKKIELSLVNKRRSKQMEEMSYRLELSEEKKLILEERNRRLESENESLRKKANVDLSRIKARERELESKLDLLKADTETQISNRDMKILELKRKIDTLEFDMESMQLKEQKTVDNNYAMEERMERVINTLRRAIGELESDEATIRNIEKIKKNLDV